MSDQYYRMFPGDYLRDTGDLTLLEHGAYMIMLHHYYTAESLPVERERLYRICRAFTKPEQQAIDTVVERYFRENGNGHLVNRRAEKELAERKIFKEKQSEKGKKSAEKRWGKKDKQEVTTVTSRLQPEVNLPSPSPSPYIKKEKPYCSSDDEPFGVFWNSYPKKVGKAAALKSWLKIKSPKETLAKILTALSWQSSSEQWTKENGKYIPNPATYLNQGRWEDEPYGNTGNGGEHGNVFLRAIQQENEQRSRKRLGKQPQEIRGQGDSQGGPQSNGGMPEDANS